MFKYISKYALPSIFKGEVKMKRILLTLAILVISTSIAFCSTSTSYDKNGNKTGSYKTNPNGTTTSYDKYRRKTGSFKTDSTGRTTQYDRYGRKVGSFK